MNWRICGRKRFWLHRSTIPAFAWRVWVKLNNTGISSGVPNEVRTDYLPNTSLRRVFTFHFSFLGLGERVHSVRRPLFGLLYQPRVIDDECGTVGGIRIGRRDWSTRKKSWASATLSTTNPTWRDLVSNPGRRRGKRATNRLNYGTALSVAVTQIHAVWEFTCVILR
jgi:hypothetical protein